MSVGQLARRLCSSAPIKMADPLSMDGVRAAREDCFGMLGRLPSFRLGQQSDRRAAVLVPIVEVRGEPALLFTLRSANLKSHAGHVAFPGGKADAVDVSLVDTALRETEEELGIPRNTVEVWGQFSSTLPSKNFEMAVLPVIGMIRDYENIILKPNPDEVEEVFTVSLRNLSDRQYFGFQEFKNGYTVPIFMGGPHKIWGLTAIITHIFLSCLLPESVYPMQFKHIGTPNLTPKL